ncbi:heparanase 2, partial [Chelydra serpentina]
GGSQAGGLRGSGVSLPRAPLGVREGLAGPGPGRRRRLCPQLAFAPWRARAASRGQAAAERRSAETSSRRLVTLARGLAPAFLRFAGKRTDFLHFQNLKNPAKSRGGPGPDYYLKNYEDGERGRARR